MDESKTDKRKIVKKALRLDSIRGYLDRYRQEVKDVNMAKKYTNKNLKRQLNAKAKEIRAKIKLIKDIENKFSINIAFEVKSYYEKYGFEGVVAVLESKNLFPSYNFLTINAILDYVDWSLNKKF